MYRNSEQEYSVCKYFGEWAIYARKSRCYVLFGKKRDMKRRVKQLNKEDK